ncbi:MAG: hypothetical protein IPM13_13310 [Phycisphaerales bacterium]|nr:hypothetical protein [Phycisphaerales bacterium]
MTLRRRHALLVCLYLAVPVLWAHATDPAEPGAYTGYQVVTVTNENWSQVEQLHALGAVLLSCHEGLGPVDYAIPGTAMADVDALGVMYRVHHPNIQELIDAERAAIDAEPEVDPRDATWFTNYKDNPAIIAKLQQMVADRPEIASLIDIGNTVEGRDIWCLRIASPGGNKPAILFNGTQHAREWVSPMVNMWIADRLVYEYGLNPQITALVDQLDFYIVPVVNVDGYVYSWQSSSTRLWRKNRRVNAGGCIGVDPNRNWGFQWGGQGASTDPCNDTYRGTAGFSEPETQALRDFFIAQPEIVSTIDFHSYSQLILSPWGYTNALPADHTTFTELNVGMRDAIQAVSGLSYTYGPIYSTIYPASGGSVDWCYGARGIFAFTIELRPANAAGGGFELPAAQILPTCTENFEAAMFLANWSAKPVKISFPNGLPTVILAAQPNPLNVQIRVLAGTLDATTPKLHYRSSPDQPFQEAPLTYVAGDLWLANLPPTACGRTLQYYFSAASTTGVPGVSPEGAPGDYYSAQSTEIHVAFHDNFETNKGWTTAVQAATAGFWQRGVPVNDPNWEYDPISDGDGSGSCYLTENALGNTDVDGGAVLLTSPAIDMTGGDYTIEYWYYLYLTNTTGFVDRLLVELSSNGTAGPWTQIALHVTNGGTNWRYQTITPAALAAAGVTSYTADMRLRFTANDADPQSIVEAGVDGVRVARIGCFAPALCPGDVDCNGGVDFDDIDAFVLALGGEAGYLAAYPDCQWLNADTNGDSQVNFDDIDGFVALIGTTCP